MCGREEGRRAAASFVWGMERGTLAYGHVLDGDRIVSINDVKPKTAKEASKIIRIHNRVLSISCCCGRTT